MRYVALVALLVLISTPLLAENLAGADKFLCAVVQQEMCTSYSPCTNGGPSWDTGIPEFLEIDAKKKTVSTTHASGTPRTTKVELARTDELIIMQAFETGKALSMIINRSTGLATGAIISDEEVIAVFATCTPK
jgi:hypothetical protein